LLKVWAQDLTILVFGSGKNMRNSTIDKRFLKEVTCFDNFKCNTIGFGIWSM
jgi:hypothetical protein